MKNKVLVIGYPKSGCTWLTRLTAELIGCPVAGFWNEPNNKEIAIEGIDRKSDYECYKAHHPFRMLQKTFHEAAKEIIYIVRDPRDVAVSAFHYFGNPAKFPHLKQKLRLMKLDFIYEWFRETRRPTTIVDALIHGTVESAWLEVCWSNHVKPYLDSDILVVRYEDLLDDPVHEAQRILDSLQLSRSWNQIETAVKKQSFHEKKRQFAENNQTVKAAFLRKGTTGQWKDELTKRQIQKIERAFGDVMRRLGYL